MKREPGLILSLTLSSMSTPDENYVKEQQKDDVKQEQGLSQI